MNLNKNKIQGSAAFILISGLVILVLALFLLVKLATSGYHSEVSDTTSNAVEARIMPEGRVLLGSGVPVGQRTGEQIFSKVCIQCHAENSTVPGVPRVTHNNEWVPRIAKGFNTLIQHAIQGFNAMPARGGAADLTDQEVARTVAYMANQSGAHFQVEDNSTAASEPAASAPTPTNNEQPANTAPVTEDTGAKKTAKVDGEAVYNSLCVACHNANSAVPFVPKITHNEDWAPRIKKGKATLFEHAIHGFTNPEGGMMPAKGGNPSLSDEEVKAAVIYMVNHSGGKF